MRRCIGLALAATCAAAAPAQSQAPRPASGSEITYSLPSTSVKITVGLTITQCVGTFKARADVAFVQSVGASPRADERFAFDGRNLSSFWKNRKLALETYPNGTIKSLNGGVSDQTGSIVASFFKAVGAIVALDGQNPMNLAGRCNDQTLRAIRRADALTTRIEALRDRIAALPPEQAVHAKAAVDAMAAEVARLQTQELHIDLAREFVLDRGRTGGTINWGRNDFAKWLRPDAAAAGNTLVRDVVVGFCVARPVPGRPAPKCDAEGAAEGDRSASQPGAPVVPACPGDTGCATTIVLREPVRATITAISLADDLTDRPSGATLKQGELTISQWGDLAYLPLRGGFGKSVNFAMGFDENGHKVSQTWDATARGTGIVGGGSQILDAALGAYRGIASQDVTEQKAETDRINTQKAYNQAKFCEAVIAAGGYTCP